MSVLRVRPVHPEIKRKKPRFQQNLYQEDGFLSLIIMQCMLLLHLPISYYFLLLLPLLDAPISHYFLLPYPTIVSSSSYFLLLSPTTSLPTPPISDYFPLLCPTTSSSYNQLSPPSTC
eukprot:3940963-Rhodomonas_salina.2